MQKSNPKVFDHRVVIEEIEQYYQDLSFRIGEIYTSRLSDFERYQGKAREEEIKKHGEAIINPREFLSIPELIKRLVTIDVVANRINQTEDLRLERFTSYAVKAFENTKINKLEKSFKDTDRFETQQWSGWFVGDGDRIGSYFRNLADSCSETEEKERRNQFSNALMNWGENTFRPAIKQEAGRLVYAGGDDFMGVFVPDKSAQTLTGRRCWKWWCNFSDIWAKHTYADDITVSVGFVWTGHAVPQREILQHCNEAEKTAKNSGRDRLAIRIVFNNGNYLEWSCPWRLLSQFVIDDSADRDWVNLYQDIAHLEARHGFTSENTTVAQAILQIYFGSEVLDLNRDIWNGEKAGILGEKDRYLIPNTQQLNQSKFNQAFNEWVIDLAKVGFYLFRDDQ